jgi:hypothetical protein
VASEIEAAAADGAGAFFRRKPKHALPIGSPCPNCATPLQGPWCHACGQSAEDFHRSLPRLMGEALEGLFELDGRLWKTLPNLLFNPAKLTRDYLDGHRTVQAPPFRTFLIVVVLVFLTASLGPKAHDHWNLGKDARTSINTGQGVHLSVSNAKDNATEKWLRARLKAAQDHPDAFKATMVTWAQRLAILTLPMSAILLGLMFFWRRRVYLFDHLIFSMHSLSFQGLLISAMMLGEQLNGAFGMLILLSPVHLFLHLKGTYRLGVFGTLIRMLLLFIGSLIGFVMILLGLVLIGLYELPA